MNKSEELCDPLKGKVRKDKNIIYKGKKYPIDFNLLLSNSDYFYQNKKYFQDAENIEILLPVDITDDSLNNFISCCQNEQYYTNDSNVFTLNLLSNKYGVTELIERTNKYINDHHERLVFQSIEYKMQFLNQNNDIDSFYIDLCSEEDILASHLIDYIKDERFLSFSVPFVDRVLNKHYQLSNNIVNEEDEKQIIDFLFRYLTKHEKKASPLFLNFGFDKRIDIIQRLKYNFSDVFDFTFFGSKYQINTTLDMYNGFSKLMTEYSLFMNEKKALINELSQMKQEMDQLKEENKKLKEKLLDFSVSPENFYLIPIGQEWNASNNTQCSLQYNGCTINVKASSSYNDFCHIKNLFNEKTRFIMKRDGQ